jgi:formylglycine-generating enzyme required for sulfatase activity
MKCLLIFFLPCFLLLGQQKVPTCHVPMPSRYKVQPGSKQKKTISSYLGMKRIPAGSFMMGSHDNQGRADEYPLHPVQLKGFYMDETEVTNADFAKFVQATNYITTAEKSIDWEELSKQVPAGTPRPPDSLHWYLNPPKAPLT